MSEACYHVFIYLLDKQLSNQSDGMDPVKSLVHSLYSVLHLEEHQLHKEQELLQRIEALKEELLPLEQVTSNVFSMYCVTKTF